MTIIVVNVEIGEKSDVWELLNIISYLAESVP